jgi:hypothetical protein
MWEDQKVGLKPPHRCELALVACGHIWTSMQDGEQCALSLADSVAVVDRIAAQLEYAFGSIAGYV